MDFSHFLGSRGWGPRPEGLLFGRSLKKKYLKQGERSFLSVLVSLAAMTKEHTGRLKQQEFMFYISGGWEVQDKPPDSWLAAGHLLAVSSQGRGRRRR